MALETDLELLTEAARAAGALAMRYFRADPLIWSKDGGSPVTEADMAVDDFLRRELLAARPQYGWLSEETADDPARRACDTIFVVDPIDGTKAFIAGDERWCVSLAVVEKGRPIAAALNVPARDELYTASRGAGAWMGAGRLTVTNRTQMAGARLSGPRGWMRTPTVGELGAKLTDYVPSLAYRVASVATGRIDVALASPRAHDWDLAACDLLVHEAGGRLTEVNGNVLCYNEEVPRHGALAAANDSLLPAALATVRGAQRDVGKGLTAGPPKEPR